MRALLAKVATAWYIPSMLLQGELLACRMKGCNSGRRGDGVKDDGDAPGSRYCELLFGERKEQTDEAE